MAIALRSIGTVAANASATTLEVSPPSGIQDGDLLVMCAVFDDDITTIKVNETGWIKEAEKTGATGEDRVVVFSYKIASSESGNYTVDGPAVAGAFKAVCAAYSGVDQLWPIDATSSNNSENSTTHDPAAVTSIKDGAMILSLLGMNQGTDGTANGTPPTGYTIQAENGTTKYLGFADKLVTTKGSQDPGTWGGLGTDADVCSITVALRPEMVISSVSTDNNITPTEDPWVISGSAFGDD